MAIERCEHRRLTWGCDSCLSRVTTDQRLAECFDCADEDCALDGTDHLVDLLEWDPGFVDTVIWWPTSTLHAVARNLRQTSWPPEREYSREQRRATGIELDPVRRAVLTEAWKRRCADERAGDAT